MADNVAITAGSGTTMAADELTDGTLGSVKVAYGKIMDGTLDSSNKLIVNSSGEAKVTPTANSQVDVNKLAGTTTDTNSGNKSAGTLRVVLATDQPALTNKLLVTPDLPSGASTAAKQPALGTAGTASADVITVQGITSMTALKVDGSGVTQPVSGTVTTTPPSNASTNITQIAGSAISQGHGTAATAVRVELPTDGTGTVTANAGTNLNTSALATSTNITGGGQKSQVVDGSGNVIGSTSNALNIYNAMAPTDSYPSYSNLSLGGIALRTDSAGNLQTYGGVISDQGTSRAWFTGSSISYSPGSATFTNGSTTVTGSGFSATDIHYLDFVKISAHGESAWAQVSYVNSDTTLTLIAAYTGATTTGAFDVSRVATVTGSGATISVASGALTIASGTTNSAASVVYKTAAFPPFQNGSCDSAFSVSQRIANQDIYYGFENATSSPRFFARFHFTSTTNTQVITETAYNPTTGPSSNETESNTITLPNGVTTAATNTYRIEAQYDRVIFYINNVIVATHTQRIMPIWLQAVNSQFRVVNGTGATSTSVVANYMFQRAYARLDTNNQSPVTTNSVNTVNALPTAQTLGTPTMAIGDKYGRPVVIPGTVRDLVGTQTTTISASTSETTVVTAAANVFNDITTIMVSNTSATATRVDFRDTTAGSVLFSIYVPAGDVRGVSASRPLPQTSVNTNWTAQSSASVTDLRVYCVFDKNK
jgi:hypothetical protein